jgi:hypothetical protein
VNSPYPLADKPPADETHFNSGRVIMAAAASLISGTTKLDARRSHCSAHVLVKTCSFSDDHYTPLRTDNAIMHLTDRLGHVIRNCRLEIRADDTELMAQTIALPSYSGLPNYAGLMLCRMKLFDHSQRKTSYSALGRWLEENRGSRIGGQGAKAGLAGWVRLLASEWHVKKHRAAACIASHFRQ